MTDAEFKLLGQQIAMQKAVLKGISDGCVAGLAFLAFVVGTAILIAIAEHLR